MRKLLRLDESMLQRVSDVSEGWKLLQSRMEEHPVFLVIDNVQFDGVSEQEARKYLNMKHNWKSKIMIISRSLDVVKGLLGKSGYLLLKQVLRRLLSTCDSLLQKYPTTYEQDVDMLATPGAKDPYSAPLALMDMTDYARESRL